MKIITTKGTRIRQQWGIKLTEYATGDLSQNYYQITNRGELIDYLYGTPSEAMEHYKEVLSKFIEK